MTKKDGRTATRPRVVCHMVTSIDGRIVVDGWPDAISASVRRQHEEVHARHEAGGWMCGRVTMEPFARRVRPEAEVAREHRGPPREDFVAEGDHRSFAFAIDPAGRLAWESNDVGGDHVVAVLAERVSDDHLASLRRAGVSYLLAGAREVDLPLALEKIGAVFGVKTLLLEGGGRVNGGLLRAGLVDELSVLVAPVVDGRAGTPALFDLDAGALAPRHLELAHVERRADDVLWLRYRVSTAG
jgi:2,5-diamino-6-(ribosylamino)-4(3H)-pyrimidinone 5'-phosphate reductase